MIGYIGMILLLIAYGTLLTRYSNRFNIIAFVASFILTIHAFSIMDIPFLIVNALITFILLTNIFKIKF
jgi:hypothetical protein